MAGRVMVANDTTRHPTILQRMRLMPTIGAANGTGTHASPTGVTFGAISEMGTGFCRAIYTGGGAYR